MLKLCPWSIDVSAGLSLWMKKQKEDIMNTLLDSGVQGVETWDKEGKHTQKDS